MISKGSRSSWCGCDGVSPMKGTCGDVDCEVRIANALMPMKCIHCTEAVCQDTQPDWSMTIANEEEACTKCRYCIEGNGNPEAAQKRCAKYWDAEHIFTVKGCPASHADNDTVPEVIEPIIPGDPEEPSGDRRRRRKDDSDDSDPEEPPSDDEDPEEPPHDDSGSDGGDSRRRRKDDSDDSDPEESPDDDEEVPEEEPGDDEEVP